MGVTGLYPLIKAHCPPARLDLAEFMRDRKSGESVVFGIEGNGVLYQCQTVDAAVSRLARMAAYFQELGGQAVIVFDGGSCPNKAVARHKRNTNRARANKQIAALDQLIQSSGTTDVAPAPCKQSLTELFSNRSVAALSTMDTVALEAKRDTVKKQTRVFGVSDATQAANALTDKGFKCILAPRQADQVLAQLSCLSLVHFVVSDDSDMLVMNDMMSAGAGHTKLLRRVTPGHPLVECYSQDKILEAVHLTADQWIALALFSENDYLAKVQQMGPKTVHKLLTGKKMTVDQAIQHFDRKNKLPLPLEEYMSEFERARKSFTLGNSEDLLSAEQLAEHFPAVDSNLDLDCPLDRPVKRVCVRDASDKSVEQ